ncbi:hypothetical protein NDR89_15590 [Cupriavidus gilardii]|uniref:Uncharacterized protein n=1 Tax=Cupriavidus gilardii TaxID=82541 RepID=A0ABY4VVD8_9BURK|nr:hypothetical protein [Cupriavidus gilardii]USE81142.1 hypothetical protein NDR89_15590 [Cupriavidus gilardii]
MVYTATPPKFDRVSALGSYQYDALDDLLYDWFCREAGYVPVKGYARAVVACAASASSDQWRESAEVLRDRVEAYVMPAISFAIDELPGDLRLAILIEQRNRMGPAVYRNPRAGDRQPEVYNDAKEAIKPILRRKGVEW